MMISPMSFQEEHKNDSYEELIAVRDSLIKDIKEFEDNNDSESEWEINPSPDVVYQCNLEYLAKVCIMISDKYRQDDFDDEHWIFRIKQYLEENGSLHNTSLPAKINERKSGRTYHIDDHIRGLIYALLTNQTKWHRIEENLPAIDTLFFNYDPREIQKHPADYYIKGIYELKCGNISTTAQMNALHSNIGIFEKIETDYGSLDEFITSDSPDKVVKKLCNSSSPYKIKMLGEALAWEYVRNMGIDGCKPDTHLRRFFGSDRMGDGESSPASEKDVIRMVSDISEQTGLLMVEIDNLIWSFCADSLAEICTSKPTCSACPIKGYCKHGV